MIDENMEKVKREASTDPERHSGLGEERGRRTKLRFYKNDWSLFFKSPGMFAENIDFLLI